MELVEADTLAALGTGKYTDDIVATVTRVAKEVAATFNN
jgi:hypothetical protein